jgi:uncharacterized Zn-binding protein involved in type VI secretion
MGMPAARVTDLASQKTPHCHAPIHPPAPVPTPMPHPGLPLMLIPPGAPTVLIGNLPAAVMGGQTMPCMLPGCIPAGPGMIMMGAPTVLISNKPAARVNDPTLHSSCVAPIPGPMGSILPPGCPTVIIG